MEKFEARCQGKFCFVSVLFSKKGSCILRNATIRSYGVGKDIEHEAGEFFFTNSVLLSQSKFGGANQFSGK